MTRTNSVGMPLPLNGVLESVAAVLASLNADDGAGPAAEQLRDAADVLAELARVTESPDVARLLGEARTTLAVYLQAARDVAEAGAQDLRRAKLLERGRHLAGHQLELVLSQRTQTVSSTAWAAAMRGEPSSSAISPNMPPGSIWPRTRIPSRRSLAISTLPFWTR